MLGTAVARTGRKRKNGYRQPNGDLVRPKVDYRGMAAAQPHRSWLPADKRLDQKADSVLGSLSLLGAITEDQYLAGMRFAVIVGAYRAQLGGPKATAGAGKGYDCDPLGCMRDGYACECTRRKNRYDGCYEALAGTSRKALMTVNRVVIHGQRCMRGEMEALRCGLDTLAKHLGLTGNRKSVHTGNTH